MQPVPKCFYSPGLNTIRPSIVLDMYLGVDQQDFIVDRSKTETTILLIFSNIIQGLDNYPAIFWGLVTHLMTTRGKIKMSLPPWVSSRFGVQEMTFMTGWTRCWCCGRLHTERRTRRHAPQNQQLLNCRVHRSMQGLHHRDLVVQLVEIPIFSINTHRTALFLWSRNLNILSKCNKSYTSHLF